MFFSLSHMGLMQCLSTAGFSLGLNSPRRMSAVRKRMKKKLPKWCPHLTPLWSEVWFTFQSGEMEVTAALGIQFVVSHIFDTLASSGKPMVGCSGLAQNLFCGQDLVIWELVSSIVEHLPQGWAAGSSRNRPEPFRFSRA